MKIIDLGLGQFLLENQHLSRLKGSIYYIAPELIHMNYTHKIDIWSCGVILYILISGKAPFDAKKYNETGESVLDIQGIQAKILEGKVDYSLLPFKYVDPSAVYLIQQMLTYNPDERPEAAQILNNPWFYQVTEDPKRNERRPPTNSKCWMKSCRTCSRSTRALCSKRGSTCSSQTFSICARKNGKFRNTSTTWMRIKTGCSASKSW